MCLSFCYRALRVSSHAKTTSILVDSSEQLQAGVGNGIDLLRNVSASNELQQVQTSASDRAEPSPCQRSQNFVMSSSFLRSLSAFGRRWKPLSFPNTNFIKLPLKPMVEEESFPEYIASRYYPAWIGEVLQDQYQIVGKLGFGASSTVWLARDLKFRRHVVLKLFVNSASMGNHLDDEVNTYKRMERGSRRHSGYNVIRSLLDRFEISGPDGRHRCLVHSPLWESVSAFLHRNPVRRLPSPVLAFVLKRVFLALDFLHTECQIIHTDIKADNIMFGVADDSVFEKFEEDELQNPCPRKILPDRVIYTSRDLRMPRQVGAPVLCDFGSAVSGETEHTEDVQPNVYRAPEVILESPWTYSIDIWNVGCMVWDVFEGEHLFTGHDQEFQSYRSRAHLAEMTALLGPPPPSLLAEGHLTQRFFDDDRQLHAGITIPKQRSFEERETTLEGTDRVMFLQLMRKMLQWQPEKRCSAKELLQDEWITKYTRE